jgi:hypothetical protein
MGLKTIMLVCAVVCFALKAFSVPTGRIDCMNLGFCFVVLSALV